MNKTRQHFKNLTTVSLCVSLMCAASFVVIPLPFTPVVVSLHTVVVALTGLVLPVKQSFSAMLVYLLMGLVGIPVFSAGTSGLDKLFGPTGGFYFGFVIIAVAVSLLKGEKPGFVKYLLIFLLVCMPLQHVLAVLFMCFHNGFNVTAAFVSVSLPFLAVDVIKYIVTAAVGVEIVKILDKR